MTRPSIVVLGECGSGKTALLKKLTGQPYPSTYQATLGVQYYSLPAKTATTPSFFQSLFGLDNSDSAEEPLPVLWELCGQHRFTSSHQGYIKQAAAAVICIDSTQHKNLARATYWLCQIQKNLAPSAPLLLAFTKSDTDSTIMDTEIACLAKHYQASALCVSAKLALNIEPVRSWLSSPRYISATSSETALVKAVHYPQPGEDKNREQLQSATRVLDDYISEHSNRSCITSWCFGRDNAPSQIKKIRRNLQQGKYHYLEQLITALKPLEHTQELIRQLQSPIGENYGQEVELCEMRI